MSHCRTNNKQRCSINATVTQLINVSNNYGEGKEHTGSNLYQSNGQNMSRNKDLSQNNQQKPHYS